MSIIFRRVLRHTSRLTPQTGACDTAGFRAIDSQSHRRARNAKQVDGIVGALTFRLTPDEIKEIEANR